MKDAYHLAQNAMADLKAAVYSLLEGAPPEGLTNAQIGRRLGIYAGHVEHEGHIPRTLLALNGERRRGPAVHDHQEVGTTLSRLGRDSVTSQIVRPHGTPSR